MTDNYAQLVSKWIIFNLAVTIWTVIIPGMAAYLNGTFHTKVVLDNLPNNIAKTQIEEDNARRERIRTSLNMVEDKIIQWTPEQGEANDLSALLTQKSELEKRLKEYRNRIKVLGFIDNETTYFGGSLTFA